MIMSWIISFIIKILSIATAFGVGIWYVSSALGGESLSYTSIGMFLTQIGVKNGDIASANGCFLCNYITQLFDVIGNATEMFWNGLLNNLWIVISIGFGVFIIIHTVNYIHEQATSKAVTNLDKTEPKLDFKKWFEKVWKTGVRVLIAGALLGAINLSGTNTLKMVTKVVVHPVMYVGSMMSMATTQIVNHAKCDLTSVDTGMAGADILTPVLKPFMCIMGNLNAVMLGGVGGGFALMNYSWMDMGGGLFTWISGLGLVILFLIIGFNLIFQVLNVIFKLVFIIIFMPLFIASYAFEEVWSMAKGLITNILDVLVNSAVDILRISLKVCIIYALAYYSADAFFPGPVDGFTTIMPPLLTKDFTENINRQQISWKSEDTKAMSIMHVFSECESVSVVDGKMDKDKFITCFNTQRSVVENRYPGAFEFMDNGFEFLIFMTGIGLLYFWVISPQIDKLIGDSSKDKLKFEFGTWVQDVWKMIFGAPGKFVNYIRGKAK